MGWLLAVLAVSLSGALWWRRVTKVRATDRHFGVHRFGTRHGILSVRMEEFIAVAGYETGASVGLIVFRRGMRTREGTGLTQLQRDQVIDRLARWAKARGTSIEFTPD
jgi:hypothetical protein